MELSGVEVQVGYRDVYGKGKRLGGCLRTAGCGVDIEIHYESIDIVLVVTNRSAGISDVITEGYYCG